MMERNTVSSSSKLSIALVFAGVVIAITGVLLLSCSLVKEIKINEQASAQESLDVSGSSDPTVLQEERWERSISGGSDAASTGIADKHVLFISSYDPTSAYYRDQISGMLSVSNSYDIQIDVVNMDTSKHRSDEDLAHFSQALEAILSTNTYDGLIVGDDPAFDFAMEHRDDYFAGMPIVFIGVNDIENGNAAANRYSNVTGYLEDSNVDSSVELVFRLLPGTRRIVAINDSSRVARVEEDLVKTLSQGEQYSGIDFEYLTTSDYGIEELQDIVSRYEDGTVILLMVAHEDKEGNFYTDSKMTKLVAEAASVPVFRNAKGGYNNGAVAGVVHDPTGSAAKAVRTMHEAPDHEVSLSDVPVTLPADSVCVASYAGMKKFDLNFSALPDDAVIVGAPASFGHPYRMFVISLVLVLAGFIMIIIGLSISIRDRRRIAGALEQSVQQLKFSNEHDFLTGACSRPYARALLDELSLQGRKFTIVLANLDNFKRLNEVYGHEAADELLKGIADDLRVLTQEVGGEVSRYNGDEFLFIFINRELQEGDAILQRIQGVFRKRRRVGLDSLQALASIGVSHSDGKAEATMVLSWGESAVARAKALGKDGCVVYTRTMMDEDEAGEREKSAVLTAVQNDGFYMVYQPQVDTGTKEVTGFEALARMKGGPLSPGIFIPIAESNGWIRQIGRMTAKMTIRQIAAWREQGLMPLPVSFNVSAGQLSDPDFVPYLRELLDTYQVPAEAIKLEMTESMFISDRQSAAAFFEACRRMNIELVMDDFGSGYSSLGLLADIPVDEVKIDKSLLDSYGNAESQSFLRDVIGLIHDVDKTAVCEGVETKDQYELLKGLGCDCIQGFYFERPQSAEQAEELLKSENPYQCR